MCQHDKSTKFLQVSARHRIFITSDVTLELFTAQSNSVLQWRMLYSAALLDLNYDYVTRASFYLVQTLVLV